MRRLTILILGAAIALPALADEGHGKASMAEQMREAHGDHEHGHDFEAMEHMSPEEMDRMMAAMADLGLAMPPMDSAHGRELFVERGCIVCHQVNGVGGAIGPAFDAAVMPEPMNVFDFAARMYRAAPVMAQMQEDLLGEAVELSGQELADLIAFVHDEAEQKKLGAEAIPERFRDLITN